MRLGGLLPLTTLDFPGLVSAVVFTQGCNFTCPYCHNPHLVRRSGAPAAEEETLAFLRRRRPLLDGVVVSGGEPTLQPDLPEFCALLKGLGYAVKLDTNGSRPEVLAELLRRRLVDYVALDLKADPHNYPPEIAPPSLQDRLPESLALLQGSGLPHEFRVTAAAPFITRDSLTAIAQAARGQAPLFLQRLRQGAMLAPRFIAEHPQPDEAELEELRRLALPFTPNCFIRG